MNLSRIWPVSLFPWLHDWTCYFPGGSDWLKGSWMLLIHDVAVWHCVATVVLSDVILPIFSRYSWSAKSDPTTLFLGSQECICWHWWHQTHYRLVHEGEMQSFALPLKSWEVMLAEETCYESRCFGHFVLVVSVLHSAGFAPTCESPACSIWLLRTPRSDWRVLGNHSFSSCETAQRQTDIPMNESHGEICCLILPFVESLVT